MYSNNGFAQVRRGLLDHVVQGKITGFECCTFITLILLADPESGIWWGCSSLLCDKCGMEIKTVKAMLNRLETKGYIKRFMIPHSHRPYPILIHKFLCTDGRLKGMSLNARDTIDYNNPIYYEIPDGSPDRRPDGRPVHIRKENEKEKENNTKKAAAPKLQPPTAFESPLLTVTAIQDQKLADTYPWIGRETEYKKMAIWLESHSRGKVKNVLAFTQNWFNKIPCPAQKNFVSFDEQLNRQIEQGYQARKNNVH